MDRIRIKDIPDDFLVAGFDGGILGEKVYTELTSIKQDMRERGGNSYRSIACIKRRQRS